MRRNRSGRLGLAAALAGLTTVLAAGPARAQRIDNAVAVFAALDKVTAKISRLEVPLNQTVTFGALKITPRVCYSRAPTEPPKTTSFVEVEETQLDGKEKRIFSGWMFADSPGLNAVEHPVFDVWLTDCSQPQRVVGPRPPQGASRRPPARPRRPVTRTCRVVGACRADGDQRFVPVAMMLRTSSAVTVVGSALKLAWCASALPTGHGRRCDRARRCRIGADAR